MAGRQQWAAWWLAVLAIAWIIAGHELHHREVLREHYL